jgi:hypothetical protein
METLNNSGIVYNIIGTFGGHPDPDYTTKDVNQEGTGSLWYLSGQHGYLDVEINGTTADLIFRSPEDVVIQSFSILE